MKVKEGKDLLDFLKKNGLDFKYWKYENGLYDIHIFNLTLMNLTFADFEDSIEMNFMINNTKFKFLHVFKTSLDIELVIGDLNNHDRIELKNVRLTWDKNQGLEILWKGKK